MIDWIKRLPPGQYDMKQLITFSGLKKYSHGSIKNTMLYYGAKIESVPATNSFSKYIYHWEGFKLRWK